MRLYIFNPDTSYDKTIFIRLYWIYIYQYYCKTYMQNKMTMYTIYLELRLTNGVHFFCSVLSDRISQFALQLVKPPPPLSPPPPNQFNSITLESLSFGVRIKCVSDLEDCVSPFGYQSLNSTHFSRTQTLPPPQKPPSTEPTPQQPHTTHVHTLWSCCCQTRAPLTQVIETCTQTNRNQTVCIYCNIIECIYIYYILSICDWLQIYFCMRFATILLPLISLIPLFPWLFCVWSLLTCAI